MCSRPLIFNFNFSSTFSVLTSAESDETNRHLPVTLSCSRTVWQFLRFFLRPTTLLRGSPWFRQNSERSYTGKRFDRCALILSSGLTHTYSRPLRVSVFWKGAQATGSPLTVRAPINPFPCSRSIRSGNLYPRGTRIVRENISCENLTELVTVCVCVSFTTNCYVKCQTFTENVSVIGK